ncbi:MAG: helix-turn-helix domain-containing protein [Terrimonas sp.]|nr:helix-turn-helix domain-containing protein [Terrimonas sp.]
MLFEFSFYSSLLLVFFVHGSVYAFLLFRKGIANESMPEKWLSLFLLLCILYIFPWMVGFAGWYNNQPYRDILFYFPFQHLYLVGPVIFFYVQSLLNPSFSFQKRDLLHFLPGILYILYCVVMLITDKLILKRYYFLEDGRDRDFDTWYQVTGYLSMIIYFFAGLLYYNRYKRVMIQLVSYADSVSFRWVRNFLAAFLAMLLVRSLLFVLGFFINLQYWDTWWYFLAFSLLFYYIAITGYANAVVTKVPFRISLFSRGPKLLVPSYEGSALVEDVEVVSEAPGEEYHETWKEKVRLILEEEKLYEDPELSLPQLAKRLATNSTVLSRAIKKGFGMNFNDCINDYRVRAVLEKLANGEHRQQTLLGIAFDCGFNSKATFNRAFKKNTGMSPKDWLRKAGL